MTGPHLGTPTRRHLLGFAAASLAVPALAQVPAYAQATDWAAVTAAAVKEGKLSFYHNMRPTGAEPLLAEFRKDVPGIRTEEVRLGSAPLMERFSTEFNANRNICDVLLTFPDNDFIKAMEGQGWAAEWSPPELAAYPARVNFRNRMFAVNATRNVIIWNKQRVRPNEVPKDWADLVDPRFKGRIAMDPPWRSVAVQGAIALWDKIGLKDMPQRLKANDVRFFEGSAGIMQAVLRGDAHVGTLADLPLEPALEDGAPVGWVYPPSGTAVSEGYVMANAKAPGPNSARVFLNWLLSARGQAVLQEQGGLSVTRPGTAPLKILPATSALANTVDTLKILTPEVQATMIKDWRAVFGVN